MAGGIIWKALLSLAILFWALLNLVPIRDTPFEDFIQQQVSAHQEEFGALFQRAEEAVQAGEHPTVFIALREIANVEKLDLTRFFPELRMVDIRNLERRNHVLMREMLNQSKSKLRLGLDLQEGISFTLRLADSAVENLSRWQREQQLEQVIQVMERRVNGLGVAEPIIRPVGESSVEIQLPGLNLRDDPEGIESLRAPARLEFRLVHRSPVIPGQEPPIGYEILLEVDEDRRTGELTERQLYVERVPQATGRIISRAGAMPNQTGGFEVSMDFTAEGSERFAAITERIAEQNAETGSTGQLAIVLDGELKSAPTVRERIRGGARISGRFSQREAIELANVLNNPLEAELIVDQLSEVSPSLAADAREKSVQAAMLGAGMVIAFMIFWYGLGGVVAVLSITVNVILVVGILASLGATLTLPGVAAIVLTVGMAVDANILIFERIREELRLGKKTPSALQGGYDKAFSTIVDANVTTLIIAAILIWLGSGPVKGFGVTLAIGISASVFCALVVSRFMLEILVDKLHVSRILGWNLIKPGNIDFFRWRKPAFVASWLIVLIGVFAVYSHWDRLFGIDFVGGDQVTVHFEQAPTLGQIEAVAQAHEKGEVIGVFQTSLIDNRQVLVLQTEEGRGAAFFDLLQAAHPEAGLTLEGQTSIGGAVSSQIQRNAIISVLVGLLGILLYVALRFEVGYGVGAVAATIHDVLMTVGIFVLFGGQFTAPMIAAVLMIVGYSINDTIVVFDRIREELQLNPGTGLRKIINLSINAVLGRSILTSFTTLLAAVSLYVAGAGIITDFAFVFIVGIITGTFSSIYIASPIFFWWHKGDRAHVESRELTPKYDWEVGAK